MNKIALITGSEGFVGPYLKRELESHGYEVFGIGCEKKENKNYYCVDITNKDFLKNAIDSVKPEYVFHLAGVSSPAFAEKNPDLTYNVNVEGTGNLLNCVQDIPNVKVLIVGSSYVYGKPNLLPIKENHPLNGKGIYTDSRIKQEKLVKNYIEKIKIVLTRSFNHTGPSQDNIYVIPKIISQIVDIKKGKREYLELGDINIKRDILDVRDVVKAYVMLLEQEKFGITCNVCRGESVSLKSVVDYGKEFFGLDDIDIIINPEFVRADEILDIYGDNSYLREFIDWAPTISYEVMLKDIFNYWNKI